MPNLFFQELAGKRKSIRKYSPRKIEKEKIKLCIEAAAKAPSACNSQPYKFIVVDDPRIKEKMKPAFEGIYSPCSFALKAPVLAVIVSQRQKFYAKAGNIIQKTDFRHMDIGIAGEHFVLQAEELGLGTCWIGWFSKKKVNQILKIPRPHSAEVIITAGYPGENPPERKKKKLTEMVSYNAY